MGAQRWCWLLAASAAVWQTVAEDEEASSRDLGISVALLWSVASMMLLMYALHYHDRDIRRYTYATVVSTISIFCAVLIFATCNDLLEWYIIRSMTCKNWHGRECIEDGDGETGMTCMVRMVHMLVWYAFTQAYLAYVCEVFQTPCGPKREQGFKTEFEKEEFKTKSKLNQHSSAMLLAHLTGFASINAWGSLQQLPFLSSSPTRSLLVLPAAILGGFTLQRITDMARHYLIWKDGEKDDKEEKWAEMAKECEDDVTGLTLSFIAVQSIRYFVSSAVPARLPDLEGAWEIESILEHGPWMTGGTIGFVAVITIAAVVLAIKAAPYCFKDGLKDEEEDESDSESETGEGGNSRSERTQVRKMSRTSSKDNCCSSDIAERFYKKVIITLSMGHAWCGFYSGQLLVALFMHRVAHILGVMPYVPHEMSLALLLASFLSVMTFFGILILDWFADIKVFDKAVVKRVILSMGLMVGFSWEQCFDKAIESIGSWSHPHTELVKALLAAGCLAVLVPAYRRFFLPMTILRGHRHGFVVQWLGERGTEELCHVARRAAETLNSRFGDISLAELRAGEDGDDEGCRKLCPCLPKGTDRTKNVLDELRKVHEVVKKLEETVGKKINAIEVNHHTFGACQSAAQPLLA